MVTTGISTQLETLLRELAQLRAENRQLRANLTRNRRYSMIVRRALVDAHLVLMAAFSDEATGAVTMGREHGLSRRRWDWAVAFLRHAGIVAVYNADWRAGLSWTVTDLAEAIELLEIAASELDGPDGYRQLREMCRQGGGTPLKTR